jgi:hypothetical protein
MWCMNTYSLPLQSTSFPPQTPLYPLYRRQIPPKGHSNIIALSTLNLPAWFFLCSFPTETKCTVFVLTIALHDKPAVFFFNWSHEQFQCVAVFTDRVPQSLGVDSYWLIFDSHAFGPLIKKGYLHRQYSVTRLAEFNTIDPVGFWRQLYQLAS